MLMSKNSFLIKELSTFSFSFGDAKHSSKFQFKKIWFIPRTKHLEKKRQDGRNKISIFKGLFHFKKFYGKCLKIIPLVCSYDYDTFIISYMMVYLFI